MTEKWVRDTGLVWALIALFFAYKGVDFALPIAAILVFTVLFVPVLLKPLGWLWLKAAEGLGFVMQHLFFGIVFFVVVTPIGLLRRWFLGDARDRKHEEKRDSALVPASGLATPESLERPY